MIRCWNLAIKVVIYKKVNQADKLVLFQMVNKQEGIMTKLVGPA